MKRNLHRFSLLLCILLVLTLCGCGQQNTPGNPEPSAPAVPETPDEAQTPPETPETLLFTLSPEADYGEMAMTFRLDWAAFRILTREEQQRLADILRQAQPSQHSWEDAPLFLIQYCDSASALPYETNDLLFARKDGQTLCRGRDNTGWFSLPEDALTQLWQELGLEPELLYDANRAVYAGFESCPEGQTLYTLPEEEAASPEEALELLFRQFLESQKAPDIRRSYRLLDVKSVECNLYDRAYIAANEGDWGWANDPGQMGDAEWCTFCSAGVTCLGTLSTWSPDSFGTQTVGDAARWGRLWLEEGNYYFWPTAPAAQ